MSALVIMSTLASSAEAKTPVRKTAATAPAPRSAPASQADASVSRPSHSATSGDLGLGIVFGEPTGLTLKKWTTATQAFNIMLSYSFFSFFEMTGDYLWHFPSAVSDLTNGKVSDEFVPYLGVGGSLLFDTSDEGATDDGGPVFTRRGRRSDVAFGLRIPLGLEFLPRHAPLGLFAEFAPGLGLTPRTFAYLEGGIGARYYF